MPLLLVLPFVVAACGSSGGLDLGTVPKKPPNPKAVPTVKPVVVPLHGMVTGSARLHRVDRGQKTALTIKVPEAERPLNAAIAHGTCKKPTALTSTTVLGHLGKGPTSWTIPTPYAQLTASPFVVVVRSGDGRIVACGNAPNPNRAGA